MYNACKFQTEQAKALFLKLKVNIQMDFNSNLILILNDHLQNVRWGVKVVQVEHGLKILLKLNSSWNYKGH